MTWSARIVKADGSGRSDGVWGSVCVECQHGQPKPSHGGRVPCMLYRAHYQIANVLTAIDVGADGHMASGEAMLKCNGFNVMVAPQIREE